MPPRIKFHKDDIVDAAFEIARTKGFSGVTARSVAEALGSSVAPIYVNFETIEDLLGAVVKRIFALSDTLLAEQNGPNLFDNIGKASLAFAREYPVFFRELVLQPNPYMEAYEEVENVILNTMAGEESMRGWSHEERRKLFFKMRAFQLGLSAMIANGHQPAWLDEKGAESILLEVGEDLWRIENFKRGEERT